MFTLLVGWHASAVSLPSGDVILALLACHLNGIIFVYIGNNKPIALQTLQTYLGPLDEHSRVEHFIKPVDLPANIKLVERLD